MSTRMKPPAQAEGEDLPRQMMAALDAMFLRMLRQGDARKHMSRLNTSPHESRALGTLFRKGALLMTELAKEMEIPLSTATNLMNRLVEKGHAVRERSEDDRRIVRVTLSPSGRKLIGKLNEFRLEASRQALSRLEPAEQQTLVELLRKSSEDDPTS